jgi:hypothetical protein
MASRLPNPKATPARGTVKKMSNPKVPNPKPSGMPAKSVPAKTTNQKVSNPKPMPSGAKAGIKRGK